MKYKKTISVLVPSELIYLFDADCEHLFIASRERGRIVARPVEEVIGGQDCDQFTTECCRDCSTCKCYNDDFDSCRVFNRME